MHSTIRQLLLVSSAALALNLGCASEPASTEEPAVEDEALHVKPKPTVVLVHGAWADALGWQKVIEPLLGDGYPVVAVENPLTSLAADIETTKRKLDALGAVGPLVVVGHSFGGAVITAAAAGNAAVKALVYVNAFAPDAGETVGDLSAKFGPTPLLGALVPDTAGFLSIDTSQFRAVFCADLPRTEAKLLAATQKPVASGAFGEVVEQAAWKTVPSWYVVGKQDQAINPDLQRYMAQRMGAHTVEIDSSHVSFVSHPDFVVHVIERAAAATAP